MLKHALSLLERSSGPVLEDYPDDCDETDSEPLTTACPVNFTAAVDQQTDEEKFRGLLQAEIATIQTWYDLAREKRARTTAELSGLSPDQIIELFSDFINGKAPRTMAKNASLSDLLRLAVEDLKAFYFEAVSAQPGQSSNASVLADWFWGETYAARLIDNVRKTCLGKNTKDMKLAGKLLLIPRNQMHRFRQKE